MIKIKAGNLRGISISVERGIWAGTLLCSATRHDSNTEKSSEVAVPPRTRPIIRILYWGLWECLVTQLRM
jgi:hypothetical protein